MRISLYSIFVNDQDKALEFYTEILGFVKKTEIPMGEVKWLTVADSGDSPDIELALEPNSHPAASAYQKALYEDGIPATSFESVDVQQEYERLAAQGVKFRVQPTDVGTTTIAVFDDSCGNWIQIHQG